VVCARAVDCSGVLPVILAKARADYAWFTPLLKNEKLFFRQIALGTTIG